MVVADWLVVTARCKKQHSMNIPLILETLLITKIHVKLGRSSLSLLIIELGLSTFPSSSDFPHDRIAVQILVVQSSSNSLSIFPIIGHEPIDIKYVGIVEAVGFESNFP